MTRERLPGILAVDAYGPIELGAPGRELDAGWYGRNLGELHDFAKRFGISQIWITANGLKNYGLGERGGNSPFLEAGRLVVPQGQDELRPWLSVWERGGHFLEVSIPSWDRGSPFQRIEFAPELLGELHEFHEATGMLWKRSGAITSDAWLRDHFAKNHLLKSTEYPEIAEDGNLEPDLHTRREPEGGEKRASRVVAFDVNAMYLGAMSSLALPVGPLGHYSAADTHPPEVGYPLVLGPGYWWSHDHWRTTPTAVYHGQTCAGEAYTWSESHRFLEPLYRTLRDARTVLLHRPDSAALEAVKQVYRQGIGRFGSTRRTRDGDPLYQPYWRHAVMAEARCRLLRRIDTLATKPVAVDVDCLYFFAGVKAASDPVRFAREVGLPLDDQVGHFKYAGAMPGKPAREILAGPSIAAAMRDLREGISK